jgi:hypothetical protein
VNLSHKHPVKLRYSYVSLLIVTLFFAGCSGVWTQHYFAMVDLDDPNRDLTFYRITINADSFLTTSQYSSGFYDADALHQLFGEVKRPDAAAGKAGSGTLQAGTVQLMCNARGQCEVGGANDRFTMIYGANADAIADQIRVFAESDNTGKGIAALLASSASADAFERITAAEQSTAQVRKNAAALATQLTSLVDGIANVKTPDALRKILLQAAQFASQKAGSSTIFNTSDLDKGFTEDQATYDALSK